MAKVVGDVAVEVSADIGPLQRGMKKGSQSVRGFERDFDKTARRMKVTAGKVAGAVGLITAALGTLGAAAQQVTATARELENLSRVSGVGVERFQTLSFAVKEYGIQQDKLADILKDTNDKIGDFLATGGGPLKDFFEEIAPKVGVTAEQFRGLNSADALELYVQTLQDANVNQAEMTFHMEAIANDAARLIPLFADNAKEMKRLEGAARDLGVVLDGDVVDRASRMHTVWDRLVDSMSAKWISFASTVLIGLDNIFGLTDAGQISNMNAKLNDLASERHDLINRLNAERERASRSMFGGNDNTEIERLKTVIEATEEEMNLVHDGMSKIQEAARQREESKKALEEALSGSGSGIKLDDDEDGGGAARFSEDDLDRLKERFASERELIAEDYEQKLEMLNEFLEKKKITQEEFLKLEEELQKKHNERMRNLEEAKRSAVLGALGGMFGDLASLMRTENERLFQIGKAASIAQATIKGYEAAVEAWDKGMKIGGPPLAAAFTAASLAKTGALISSIANTSSSGGGSSGGAGGAGGAVGAGGAPQVQTQRVDLNIIGGDSRDRMVARQVIETLNSAQRDGFRLDPRLIGS